MNPNLLNIAELELILERMFESKLALQERMKQLQLQLDAMKSDSRATEDMNYYCSLDHGMKNLEKIQVSFTDELRITNGAIRKVKQLIIKNRLLAA